MVEPWIAPLEAGDPGPYAVQHPDKVESLLLYAPIYNPEGRATWGPPEGVMRVRSPFLWVERNDGKPPVRSRAHYCRQTGHCGRTVSRVPQLVHPRLRDHPAQPQAALQSRLRGTLHGLGGTAQGAAPYFQGVVEARRSGGADQRHFFD